MNRLRKSNLLSFCGEEQHFRDASLVNVYSSFRSQKPVSDNHNNLTSAGFCVQSCWSFYFPLKDTYRENATSNKLKRLQKVWMVHWINFSEEVFILKLDFQKNKVVCGKTPFFVIRPVVCTSHSSCLKTGFWQRSLAWKCCVFNCSTFN